MSSESRRLKSEIAHCLFIDIVGFSLRSIQEQRRMVQSLREAVRASPELQRAEADAEILLRDQGDGLALVFFRDPVAPAQCAIEIARRLRERGDVPVRMGIHSGPVTRDAGLSDQENVYGGGINMAQRVMDCGDARHILLSQRSAEDLRQFEEWASLIHEMGQATVKHGERLHLFSLCDGEVGSVDLPPRLKSAADAAAVADNNVKTAAQLALSRSDNSALTQKTNAVLSPGIETLRVALLYKRNSKPDEHVLKMLESELREKGCDVFVDRHLTIGVEWAREIERQVCTSDAVIVLLSEASLRSEMLEYEIQTAYQAAQVQQGKPRILPVRLRYTGPLTDNLKTILDPLHYALWNSPEDDVRLLNELVAALLSPASATVEEQRHVELESVGGAVPIDSKFYISRPVDAAFLLAIERQDSIVLVKGARQMGKTSLLARGLQKARERQYRVIYTDLQAFNAAHFESANTLLLAMATSIAGKLKLPASPRDHWDPDLGANMNMDYFLESEVLERIDEPLVWGLDEIDRLFSYDFGSELFGLFRSWHNRRALDPAGPWGRLTLAIAYATEAHLFITDLNQSPFNVGTRLAVEDFSPDQVAELNERYGTPLKSVAEIGRFYELVSGHPYLVRRGLDEMVTRSLNLDELAMHADRDEGLFGDHLRRLLVSLSRDSQLLETMRHLLSGGSSPNEEDFYRLRSAGVLVGASAREARIRCRLYASYLSRHLLQVT